MWICGIPLFLDLHNCLAPLTMTCFFFLHVFKELPPPKNSLKCTEKLRQTKGINYRITKASAGKFFEQVKHQVSYNCANDEEN